MNNKRKKEKNICHNLHFTQDKINQIGRCKYKAISKFVEGDKRNTKLTRKNRLGINFDEN